MQAKHLWVIVLAKSVTSWTQPACVAEAYTQCVDTSYAFFNRNNNNNKNESTWLLPGKLIFFEAKTYFHLININITTIQSLQIGQMFFASFFLLRQFASSLGVSFKSRLPVFPASLDFDPPASELLRGKLGVKPIERNEADQRHPQ